MPNGSLADCCESVFLHEYTEWLAFGTIGCDSAVANDPGGPNSETTSDGRTTSGTVYWQYDERAIPLASVER